MVFLNTYWTASYALMLLFVFVTLFYVAASFVQRTLAVRGWSAVMGCGLWAGLGTFFFHCVW